VREEAKIRENSAPRSPLGLLTSGAPKSPPPQYRTEQSASTTAFSSNSDQSRHRSSDPVPPVSRAVGLCITSDRREHSDSRKSRGNRGIRTAQTLLVKTSPVLVPCLYRCEEEGPACFSFPCLRLCLALPIKASQALPPTACSWCPPCTVAAHTRGSPTEVPTVSVHHHSRGRYILR
jgi:hypothetical protein